MFIFKFYIFMSFLVNPPFRIILFSVISNAFCTDLFKLSSSITFKILVTEFTDQQLKKQILHMVSLFSVNLLNYLNFLGSVSAIFASFLSVKLWIVNFESHILIFPRVDLSSTGVESGDLYTALWKACAGPMVNVPCTGERVYYFPQGHLEQVGLFFTLIREYFLN